MEHPLRRLFLNGSEDADLLDDEPKKFDPRADFVRMVARQTGITEEQVREIMAMVGLDYSSVMREARIVKRDNPS
ncbi:conserved hypothetical protein [Mesorhizobium sp. SOD10]|nr:conserved hypothetical protein [Mesorhizobium sp. SOD10]